MVSEAGSEQAVEQARRLWLGLPVAGITESRPNWLGLLPLISVSGGGVVVIIITSEVLLPMPTLSTISLSPKIYKVRRFGHFMAMWIYHRVSCG